MFVHGEQADTILASLLALMASLQSLSRCLLVKIVPCPACFIITAKPCKIPLVLLSYTAEPKISQRGKKKKSQAQRLKVVKSGDTDDTSSANIPPHKLQDAQATLVIGK